MQLRIQVLDDSNFLQIVSDEESHIKPRALQSCKLVKDETAGKDKAKRCKRLYNC